MISKGNKQRSNKVLFKKTKKYMYEIVFAADHKYWIEFIFFQKEALDICHELFYLIVYYKESILLPVYDFVSKNLDKWTIVFFGFSSSNFSQIPTVQGSPRFYWIPLDL